MAGTIASSAGATITRMERLTTAKPGEVSRRDGSRAGLAEPAADAGMW
jgi:hypothetical protein